MAPGPASTAQLRALIGLVVLVAALLTSSRALAAPPTSPDETPLVAVKQAPPFAVRSPDGDWSGPSIELWKAIATTLELDYAFHETTLDDMLAGVAEGRYAVAVAAITVTPEREQSVDFTHPFHHTGLAIAVSSSRTPYWRGVVETVFSWTFVKLIMVLAAMQILVGTVVWSLERRANPEQFPATAVRGVLTGFWWATVTMTTVGYGDKAPKSFLGRSIALLWMLCSMVIIASVTATIASSLTIERLDARIGGPEDLKRFEVGVIANTTGADYADKALISARSFASADEALAALAEDEIDALVWDEPLLRGAIDSRPQLELELVPGVFARQDYAIAVGEGSPLLEGINRVLLDKRDDFDFDGR